MAAKAKNDFRKTLRKALFLDHKEADLYEQIPDAVLDAIFKHNFNGNLAMAERVLFNRHSEVDRVDRGRLEQEKAGIHNMSKGAEQIAKALSDGRQILFLTDSDNDGSLAQAILLEYVKALPEKYKHLVDIEYVQPIGNSRGLTKEIVDLSFQGRQWAMDEDVLIVTADNGINNRMEVERINAVYPNVSLMITDHHLPMEDLVVQENHRTMIVNPKYKPSEYFKKKNISGANTLGVLVRQSLFKTMEKETNSALAPHQTQALTNIDEIGSWANLLDYANADMADMPVRPYIIEKALALRPLLNVSNSMSNIVTGSFSDAEIAAISDASKKNGSPGVEKEWIREKIDGVKAMNIMARKLLNMTKANWGEINTMDTRDFYSLLAGEINSTYDTYESVNPNFIEQLRPYIFNLAAIDNKDTFWALMYDTMVQLYKELRMHEGEILKGLRDVSLLEESRKSNSIILYPVDSAITKVFNRKLLGKAYNHDNNGFLLILSSFDKREATGSMRSLYPISKLLEDKSEIEEKLGITVEFQGHEQAAGFFIRSANKNNLNERVISEFNTWMDDRVGEMKIAERINQIPTIEIDFSSCGLIEKINNAVKANLAGMWGVPAVIRFDPGRADGVWLTDTKTTEQINMSALVDRKKFGYQAIATDFGDGAIVLAVEQMRAVAESGYKKGIRLAYLDEGVFMGSQVVDVDSLPNLTPVKGGRRDQEELSEYYDSQFKRNNFMTLTRADFQESPYFKFNKHGQSEFELFESLVIHLLDRVDADVLAVVDTEGTGLGKAPKCFNLGGTNIKIAENSGKNMSSEDFEKRYFRTPSGREYLLSDEQLATLAPVDEGSEIPDSSVVLHKTSLNHGVSYGERFVFDGDIGALEKVTNVKEEENGDVVYNRHIDGFAFSYLINNHDFAITKEFEELTGIGNWMVEKHGKPASSVDSELTSFYENMKTPDGRPARIIFQAHNMPYDRGVISANFDKLDRFISDNLSSDTAKIARQAKLAYDDTPVSSFDNVLGLPPKAYFYDSPYSDYSLTTFLERAAKGKSGVFADTTAKILLRYNAETQGFSVIDRVANREVLINEEMESILQKKQVGKMPNNAVKYSVERMSSRAMIRNIVLLDKGNVQKVPLLPDEEPYRAALELFQENYHFDLDPQTNIDHFRASLFANESYENMVSADVDLTYLAERFLNLNKRIQAKFHDGWIYEKVLNVFEPDAANLRVPSEIVEQVNYFTDLPSSKIKKVFEDVIKFKRHFKVDHALVHEQHNNIRQRSENGQGLSDTAYESILPQHLGMMKFFNPYYQSVKPAVEEMIRANIQGSMVQTMMAREYNNEIAMDSYSMAQMTAFRRHGKTELIKRAQDMSKKGEIVDGKLAPIKFKLSGDVLTPGTAVYATPIHFTSMKQIKEDAEKLEFILVNEQMKTAAMGKKISEDYRENIQIIAAANNKKAIEYRDDLMTRYSFIEWNKNDADMKKMLDIVKEAFDGKTTKIPANLLLKSDMLKMGLDMISDLMDVCDKTGMKWDYPTVETLTEKLKSTLEEISSEGYEAVIDAAAPDDVVNDLEEVRRMNFLPILDIKRIEPLKSAFSLYGINYCFAALMKSEEEKNLEYEHEGPARKGPGI